MYAKPRHSYLPPYNVSAPSTIRGMATKRHKTQKRPAFPFCVFVPFVAIPSLFMPQSNDRIYAHRAAGRNQTAEQADTSNAADAAAIVRGPSVTPRRAY